MVTSILRAVYVGGMIDSIAMEWQWLWQWLWTRTNVFASYSSPAWTNTLISTSNATHIEKRKSRFCQVSHSVFLPQSHPSMRVYATRASPALAENVPGLVLLPPHPPPAKTPCKFVRQAEGLHVSFWFAYPTPWISIFPWLYTAISFLSSTSHMDPRGRPLSFAYPVSWFLLHATISFVGLTHWSTIIFACSLHEVASLPRREEIHFAYIHSSSSLAPPPSCPFPVAEQLTTYLLYHRIPQANG